MLPPAPLKARPPVRCASIPRPDSRRYVAPTRLAPCSSNDASGSKRDVILQVRRGFRGRLGRGGAKGQRQVLLAGLGRLHPGRDLELLAVDLGIAAIIRLAVVALRFEVIPENRAGPGV